MSNGAKCRVCGHVISKHRLSIDKVRWVCTVDNCSRWQQCGNVMEQAEKMLDKLEARP